MKAIKSYIITLAAVALVIVPFVAYAQTPTDRNRLIGEHCQSFAGLIDQLQRRDLVSRTNLGREYEAVNRQLNAFNQRLRNNDIDAKPFEQLTVQFTEATNAFRAAYVRYDDSLNKLLTIDCKTDPTAFDAQLATARSQREATLSAVNRAGEVIGQYRAQVQQLSVQGTQPNTNGVAP